MRKNLSLRLNHYMGSYGWRLSPTSRLERVEKHCCYCDAPIPLGDPRFTKDAIIDGIDPADWQAHWRAKLHCCSNCARRRMPERELPRDAGEYYKEWSVESFFIADESEAP